MGFSWQPHHKIISDQLKPAGLLFLHKHCFFFFFQFWSSNYGTKYKIIHLYQLNFILLYTNQNSIYLWWSWEKKGWFQKKNREKSNLLVLSLGHMYIHVCVHKCTDVHMLCSLLYFIIYICIISHWIFTLRNSSC